MSYNYESVHRAMIAFAVIVYNATTIPITIALIEGSGLAYN